MALDILNKAVDWKETQEEVFSGQHEHLRDKLLRGGLELDMAGVVMTEFIENLEKGVVGFGG